MKKGDGVNNEHHPMVHTLRCVQYYYQSGTTMNCGPYCAVPRAVFCKCMRAKNDIIIIK